MKVEARGVTVAGILHDVDLAVRGGEAVALLGPSGAGKTTLLRALHGLRKPDAGRVTADGAPGVDRRRIGYVQQVPGLLRGSLLDNVAWPLRARGVDATMARERALAALSVVRLAHRQAAPARRLSGGEAQRAALARALVIEPALLLLDEFTNHLDPESEATAETAVSAVLDAGCAVVLVTHALGQARRVADRVVFLNEGRVVAAGEVDRVLDAPADPLVEAYVRRQHGT